MVSPRPRTPLSQSGPRARALPVAGAPPPPRPPQSPDPPKSPAPQLPSPPPAPPCGPSARPPRPAFAQGPTLPRDIFPEKVSGLERFRVGARAQLPALPHPPPTLLSPGGVEAARSAPRGACEARRDRPPSATRGTAPGLGALGEVGGGAGLRSEEGEQTPGSQRPGVASARCRHRLRTPAHLFPSPHPPPGHRHPCCRCAGETQAWDRHPASPDSPAARPRGPVLQAAAGLPAQCSASPRPATRFPPPPEPGPSSSYGALSIHILSGGASALQAGLLLTPSRLRTQGPGWTQRPFRFSLKFLWVRTP
nr:proline-rich protein 2-like [Loxodonta africana]